MAKKVTLDDIARAVGVSKNTVSLALRDLPGVSEAVKQQITEAAQRMGYDRPGAPAPKSAAPRFILALLPESIGPYATTSTADTTGLIPRLYYHLQLCAQKQGCGVVPYVVHVDEEESCDLPTILSGMRFLGAAAFGALNAPYLKAIMKTGLNLVTVHEYVDGLDANAVTSDDCYAGYVMTKHLIEMGHRKIAYLGEKYYMAKYMDRWQGYCRAMSQYNLPIMCNAYSETTVHAQREDVEARLLDQSLSAMRPRPTGIVCGEDFTAMRVERALARLNLRVPEDISLVGFDDVFRGGFNTQRLFTTYRADAGELSRTALDLLLHPGRKPRRIIIYGEPVWRDSVRRLDPPDE